MKPHPPSALLGVLCATLLAASQAASVFQIPPKSQVELFPRESVFLSFVICDRLSSLDRVRLSATYHDTTEIITPTANVTLHYNNLYTASDRGVVYAVWPWQSNNNNNNNEECWEFILRALNKGQNNTTTGASIQLWGIDATNHFNITFLNNSSPDNMQQQQLLLHKQHRIVLNSSISSNNNNISIALLCMMEVMKSLRKIFH